MNEQANTGVAVSNQFNTSQDETIAKMKKQNPGLKIKKVNGGGFQITNPRAPSSLLNNLIKRVTK
jgi:hypothetical protein